MTPTGEPSPPAADLPELCHALMERAPVPMAELEGAGHIMRYVNPAFCRLVGKDRKTLMGKPFAEIVQEGDRCLDVLDRVYRTTEPETHTESEHPEPHPAYWSYAIWPVLDANQRSVGMMLQVTETTLFHQQTAEMNQELLLSSVRQHELREAAEKLSDRLRAEITERKRAEEALRQSQAQLENRVAERTTELQQVNAALSRDMEERKKLEEQLLQSQKMESIGVLAGGIAHDFNNILNIIQGYAYVLRGQGTQEKEVGESLTAIDETVHRGSVLVQQLLTLARKSTPKAESVNVNGLVEGLITLIRQTFPKTIELSPILEADLPPITADKNQIEQALLNLCVNARDAMSDGGKLSFKTQSIEGATLQGLGKSLDGRYVCIEVSDTGVGMDESTRQRIFEPFFTTKRMSQGTGLGLSVVYGIVENHNGFINVESKPESGTSFKLYFPVAQSLEKPATDEIAEASFETTERPNGHGTILLVEDEKNMLDLLEKTLARHGYQVLAAADGETALNIYRRSKEAIDVVLLDLDLPKVAGRDVLLRIKKENPGVKVVIASGYLEPELKSEINRAGVKYFLPKPYRPDEVVRTLQSLIEGES